MIIEKPVPYWPGWFAREDGKLRKPTGEIMTGTPAKHGHRCFFARKSTWKYWYTQWVHRFVALAWVPNPRPDIFRVVDHIDRNPSNNKPTNLRWLTYQLNSLNNNARNTHFDRKITKWGARVGISGKQEFLGYFKTEQEAYEVAQAFKKDKFKLIYHNHLNEPRSKISHEPVCT